MARKIVLKTANAARVLTERAADSEAQLQDLLNQHPDLLPLEDFGLHPDAIVIGKESSLPSGAVDLVQLTRSGDILLVELKTGPDNQDFRRALAQLLDYGSDLWGLGFAELEEVVAKPYFASDVCTAPECRGKTSIKDAATATWGVGADEWIQLQSTVEDRLTHGAFEYVIAAQRFTPTIRTTIDYLNAVASGPRFHGVELIHFSSDEDQAFESRALVTPRSRVRQSNASTGAAAFLAGIGDPGYREAVQTLLETATGQGLRVEWGSVGCSLRVSTAHRAEPISVGWIMPLDKPGWLSLRGVVLGVDRSAMENLQAADSLFDDYLKRIAATEGAVPEERSSLNAWRLPPDVLIRSLAELKESIADVSMAAREGSEC